MNSRITGLLGIAARSKKLVSGDSVLPSIRSKKAKLVFLAEDCGSNSSKKILDKCRFYGIPWIEQGTAAELSVAVGQPKRVAVAIVDEGLARAIQDAVME